MTCEWKYRRQTYYALHGDRFTDRADLNTEDIRVIERWDPKDIVSDALNYAIVHTNDMYYPGKAYMIAVQYASWIQDHFGGDVIELLSDPELLPDDVYFKPYPESKEIYDQILAFCSEHNSTMNVGEELPYLMMTYNYFLQEFMLDESGLLTLPRNSVILDTKPA